MPRRLLSKPKCRACSSLGHHSLAWRQSKTGSPRTRQFVELQLLRHRAVVLQHFRGKAPCPTWVVINGPRSLPLLGIATTLCRSPLAPPYNFKQQISFEFNNYLRSTLTLRGLSSLTVSLGKQTACQDAAFPLNHACSLQCGRRTRLGSVLNHVDVDPVSRPIRTASNR